VKECVLYKKKSAEEICGPKADELNGKWKMLCD
jgi:hypothetical protein